MAYNQLQCFKKDTSSQRYTVYTAPHASPLASHHSIRQSKIPVAICTCLYLACQPMQKCWIAQGYHTQKVLPSILGMQPSLRSRPRTQAGPACKACKGDYRMQAHTRKPTRMPLRCPTNEALGIMMDVRMSDANGVRYIGMLPKPKTLKLAAPPTASTVIHLKSQSI